MMYDIDRSILRLNSRREEIITILKAAVTAVAPHRVIRNWVYRKGKQLIIGEHSFDLSANRRILVVGGGKASAAMAATIEEILGDYLTAGIVNTKYGHTLPTTRVKVNEAGHPLPDENGIAGLQEMTALCKSATEDDLIIFLLSGGGSALLPFPAPGITLAEQQRVTELCLRCGATINEINTIRKHISAIKGGGLARLAYPATVVSLILSDVIGDPLDVIASGPTIPDQTTFTDAYQVLNRYQLWQEIPPAVRRHIEQGCRGEVPETPKPDDPIFERTYTQVVGNNEVAIRAAVEKAEEKGYNVLFLSSRIEGEAREVGKFFVAIAHEVVNSSNPIARKAMIISGGETTVTMRGNGKGGRNQELALSAAISLTGLEDVIVVSLATDGTDGPTDAAGGMIDSETVQRAHALGLNPRNFLACNDSYPLLQQTGDLLISGPTATNVNDLMMVFVF
ncbi:glycerate kinase [Candidatus Bipolaricaulota bacterium]|nr:glycerate kinase [Candidatus Bipolaricaulota bacterium]